MITLFHCHDARSFRPLWALEELGLDYDLKMLPFPPRWRAKEFLTLNPLGTVPLFLDGGARMTESAAILEYLAGRYGEGALAIAPDAPGYPAYLNGLHFGEATLTFPQTLVLRYSRLEPEERRQPKVASDYARWFLGRVQGFQLDGGYAAGGRFSVADISIGYALLLAHELGLNDQLPPAILEYWARITDRDGFRRAKAAQALAAQEQGIEVHPVGTLGT